MKLKNKFLHSLNYAFCGMKYFFLYERNGSMQLVVTIVVLTLAVGLKINTTEWLFVLLCVALVLCLEMMNTAIETLCDAVQEEIHPQIKIVKDVAAGAVLFSSIIAVIVACFIFLPKISKLYEITFNK